ncbi:hypothetical protein GE21DRAFT_5766 [Neurospora crassa]|uniref:Uncharacterized protein n=1 Tax=Neurospora crassa (strain ATCC 24698 / 74-OR23-1A / CBS 708.71 / DSM 1257 / FGSC 987) TaxID=367110 RepID=Q7S9N6_NEUCR|nr:hypothetical protein NCU07664 [Neurospora crassa OR74A]EAA33070.2 hypothetical protein NCU07664 [Neurospora crassa OR74A]KHE84733.1 hypothetical protein GE21DRAFT_5766 [Neurospora crassa]|eukprot:XP_962306.2 hypothetical protein NCU07664 [Neurospora crassa OR74A]
MDSMSEPPGRNTSLAVPKTRENKALEHASTSMVNLLEGYEQCQPVNPVNPFQSNQHNRVTDLAFEFYRTDSCTSLRNQRPRMSPSPCKTTRSPNFLLQRARQLITDHKDLKSERERGGNRKDIILAACANTSRPQTPTPLSRMAYIMGREESQSSPRLQSSQSVFNLNAQSLGNSIASCREESSHSVLETGEKSQRGHSSASHSGSPGQSAEKPFMLVPKVIVTPEIKALENGVTSL